MSSELKREASRRRLLHALGAAGVASTLSAQWVRPLTRSVVLPAHAQATPATGTNPAPWGIRGDWMYDNTAPIEPGQEPADLETFGFGSGPCGALAGPWLDSAPLAQVWIGTCERAYRITRWVIGGVDVIAAPVPFEGINLGCEGIVVNFAVAMNSVDPNGNWVAQNDGINPRDGGCGWHVVSPDTFGDYGEMVVEDRDDPSRVWTLTPVVRT